LVSGLRILVVKEIKEMLRDPKILIGMLLMPLIIFPLLGAAMNVSTTAIQQSLKEASMALMDLDGGPMAQSLIVSFRALNVTLLRIYASTVDEALQKTEESNVSALLVIPAGFSQNLTSGLRAELLVYSLFKTMSLSEEAKSSFFGTPIAFYENLLVQNALREAFPNRSPEVVLDPISPRNFVVFRRRAVEVPLAALRGLFMTQSYGFTVVIMMLVISGMQIAATSIAIEKEEKTLETLLTLPVGRLTILTGKLAGSVVVAAAGAAAAMVGVDYYTSSLFSLVPTQGVDLEALGLALSPTASVLLGVTMFVTIVSALALAICVAVFSENVRSAQSIITFLITPVIMPSLILMFADIEILPVPVQVIMYAIPYTHAVLASKAAFIADYFIMLRSIAYISLFTVVILYVAARIFATEKIITARISFGRLSIGKRRLPS